MTELIELTLTQIIEGLQSGEFSSKELTQSYLRQIEILNPQINAYLAVDSDAAVSLSDLADRRLADWRKNPGDEIHPLAGVPIAVKDVLCVKGMPCTCGSRILEHYYPPYDATSVERLISAGAIVIGKTNMDEFAMGSSTENSAYGVTKNPWILNRVPGGSSGGSAAAVSSRMAPAALGTDTGGSVRQPAAFCGLSGLKPTYGRVSRYGLVAYGSSFDVVGVIGHSASDISILYNQMAGYDPLDATSVDQPNTNLHPPSQGRIRGKQNPSLKGLRIGIPDEYFISGMQPEVEELVNRAIQELADLGAEIKSVSLPHTEHAVPVYYIIAPAEASANLARYDGIRYGPRVPGDSILDIYRNTRGQKFGAEVKRRIMLGTYALSAGYYDAYYGQAQKVRTLIKSDFDETFTSVDLIAAPVSPTTAFPIGEHQDDPLSMYLEDIFTIPANLAGIPAIAFPVGFDLQSLPVGMQLMAPQFMEDQLLNTVHVFQQATDWHKRRPPIS